MMNSKELIMPQSWTKDAQRKYRNHIASSRLEGIEHTQADVDIAEHLSTLDTDAERQDYVLAIVNSESKTSIAA